MDNKKFEKLIDLIINENEEQARDLFHDIVVEKSREIYESIMDEEMDHEMTDEGMGGQVGDLMDEISAEESGVTEEEDFIDDSEEVVDLSAPDSDEEMHSEEDLEDRVVKIEDKLDELMAEFEEIMNDEDHDMGDEDLEDLEDVEDAEDDMEDAEDDMEDAEDDMEDAEDDMEDMEDMEDEEVMEAVQLQKVAVTHGDHGAQKKSTVAANSGQSGMASKPVKFSGDSESVPTSPKKPSNYATKGEKDLPGAGNFKNVPGQKKVDLSKAPSPVKSQASGVNNKSPIAK